MRTVEHLVSLNDCEVRVCDEGPVDAPCVVFSHSIMTDANMWRPQIDLLREDYRVVSYDSRGHGKSTAGEGGYSIASLASDVVNILDALAVDKAHFVGLSLGGIVGYDLSVKHRDRLHSLVICDARADSPEEFARPWDARIEAATNEGMAALAAPTLSRWFGPEFLQSEQARAVDAMIRQTSVAGFVATARALQRYDYLGDLGAIKVPVSFIVGERDGVLPDVMASTSEMVQGSRHLVIPSAGHLPNLENPADFNDALTGHLRRHG